MRTGFRVEREYENERIMKSIIGWKKILTKEYLELWYELLHMYMTVYNLKGIKMITPTRNSVLNSSTMKPFDIQKDIHTNNEKHKNNVNSCYRKNF